MDAPISKSLLRKVALDYRRLLGSESFERRNEKLCLSLLEFVAKGSFRTIHIFLPIKKNNEPDVTSLLPQLRSEGVRIVTSKTNFGEKTLSHFFLTEETQTVTNNWGIPEPVDAEEADFLKVDLVLVPLAVGDKSGNRIGYGGGFYDQLLKDSTALKVGLSLAPLFDQIAQTEEWDVPLDRILTPFDQHND